jgi:hypothetical protein
MDRTRLPRTFGKGANVKHIAVVVSVLALSLGFSEARAQAARTERNPPAALASLAVPKAGGPMRILLVDDNASPNNVGNANRNEGSDDVYRALVAAAVGGDANAWSFEVAPYRKDGPALERLRGFNVVVWYTGDSYGAGADTLSQQDENTARRYLQETGGAFVLISPGYVSNLLYGATWQSATYPFLTEVMGVDGVAPLAQRFATGRVTAANGTEFAVVHPGVAETQFSAVNSNGAAIVFTSTLDPARTASGAVPVAVANSFGGGRFVYVGFTLENIPAAGRAKAFGLLLDAATGRPVTEIAPPARTTLVAPMTPAPSAPAPATVTRRPVGVATGAAASNQTLRLNTAPPGPPVTRLRVRSEAPGRHKLSWDAQPNTGISAFAVHRRNPGGWNHLGNVDYRNTQVVVYDDRSLLVPNTAYKVVSIYSDGREGEATVEYANPPSWPAPTNFRVVQIGQGEIRIEWINVPGLDRYRLFGPGFPGVGASTGWTTRAADGRSSLTLTGLSTGPLTFRVAADYGGGGTPLLTTPQLTATVNIVNVDRSTYRIVYLGLRLDQPVADDIFDGDGKGNEIFAGAMLATATPHTRDTDRATTLGFAETLVYGDNRDFGDRIRAGTAGGTGGLRIGDFVPGPEVAAAQPGVVGTNDRFPLKLWEGEMRDTSGDYLAVIPIVIEWNATDHSTLSHWLNFWGIGNALSQLSEAMTHEHLRSPLTEARPLFGTWGVTDHSKRNDDPTRERRPNIPHHTPAAHLDRPIGLIFAAPPQVGVVPVYGHDVRGFVFSRARIEAAIPPGSSIATFQLHTQDVIGGVVRSFFQVERLTPLQPVAPRD